MCGTDLVAGIELNRPVRHMVWEKWNSQSSWATPVHRKPRSELEMFRTEIRLVHHDDSINEKESSIKSTLLLGLEGDDAIELYTNFKFHDGESRDDSTIQSWKSSKSTCVQQKNEMSECCHLLHKGTIWRRALQTFPLGSERTVETLWFWGPNRLDGSRSSCAWPKRLEAPRKTPSRKSILAKSHSDLQNRWRTDPGQGLQRIQGRSHFCH